LAFVGSPFGGSAATRTRVRLSKASRCFMAGYANATS
jgi:hypothetical protein